MIVDCLTTAPLKFASLPKIIFLNALPMAYCKVKNPLFKYSSDPATVISNLSGTGSTFALLIHTSHVSKVNRPTFCLLFFLFGAGCSVSKLYNLIHAYTQLYVHSHTHTITHLDCLQQKRLH